MSDKIDVHSNELELNQNIEGKLNTSRIKKIGVFFFALTVIAIIGSLVLTGNKNKKDKIEEEKKISSSNTIPNFLKLKPSDYEGETNLEEENSHSKRKESPETETVKKVYYNNDQPVVFKVNPEKTTAIEPPTTNKIVTYVKPSTMVTATNDTELQRRSASMNVNVSAGSTGSQQNQETTTTYGQGGIVLPTEQSSYTTQNQYAEKMNFLSSIDSDSGAYLETGFQSADYPENEIKAGTYITVTLDMEVVSDVAGAITARVIYDVRDSYSLQNVLIPKGSKVIGKFDSNISFGQSRALIIWERIIFPNLTSVNLVAMQGMDKSGSSGMTGYVDSHINDIMAGALSQSAIEVGINMLQSSLSKINVFSALSEFSGDTSVAETTTDMTMLIFERMINIQPTITIPAGTQGNVYINKDIILPTYY